MAQNFRQIFGNKIKKLRELHNLSQPDLQKICGYASNGMISLIENGERGMDIEKVTLVAKYFHIPISILMSNNDYDIQDLRLILKLSSILKNPNKRDNAEKIKMIEELLGQ